MALNLTSFPFFFSPLSLLRYGPTHHSIPCFLTFPFSYRSSKVNTRQTEFNVFKHAGLGRQLSWPHHHFYRGWPNLNQEAPIVAIRTPHTKYILDPTLNPSARSPSCTSVATSPSSSSLLGGGKGWPPTRDTKQSG